MPFDLRCPDCRAKLRLDEKPGRDDPVECPKCGGTFTPAESAAADKAAPAAAEPAPEKKDKKKKETGPPAEREGKEREFFNPFAMLAIVAVGLGAYVGFAWFVLYTLGKSGRVEDMVLFVPKDCNVVRGASLQVLNRYPGYKEELGKYTPKPITDALDGLAKAAGLPPEDFQDYMVYGKLIGANKAATTTVFAFRCKSDLDPEALKAGLKATAGQTGMRMPADAPGILAGALVDVPTKRHVVVAPKAGNADQGKAMAGSRAGAADRDQSFVGHLGDTGRVVIRGHGWLLIRMTGGHEKSLAGYVEPFKEGLPALSAVLKDSKLGGFWNSYGGSVRFGGAIDCPSSESASGLASALKKGPLGNEDMDLPRGLKSAVYVTANKEFGPFRSDFSFRSSGTCAYYTTGMQGDGAKSMLNYINLQTLGDGGAVAAAPAGGGGPD